jgi:transposase
MKTGRPALQLVRHHSPEELRHHFQQCTCAVERRRTQAIWWLTEGKSRQEVAELSAYSKATLVQLINRYNAEGLPGLKDKRHENPGAPALLSDAQLLHLAQCVRKDYAEAKLWNGQQVVRWLKEHYQCEVYPQRAYEYLRQIGMSLQQPRPRHVKADELAQETFKKNSP